MRLIPKESLGPFRAWTAVLDEMPARPDLQTPSQEQVTPRPGPRNVIPRGTDREAPRRWKSSSRGRG